MPTPLQTDHVRATNRRAVYRALADGAAVMARGAGAGSRTAGGAAPAGGASRSDLAQRTGLSTPTVAAILGDLAALGLIRDAGQDAATGGRPAQRVALAADARHVLAVDLSGRRARAHRVDLLGRPGAPRLGPEVRPGGDAELLAWLAALADDAEAPPLAHLAVAVPGVVDARDGRVRLAPALGWTDEPAGERLAAATGLPVLLENDVNALALAEGQYGRGRGHEHVVFVAIGSGVGAGLVVHGQLVRGAHAAAGEIGYAATPGAAADSARTVADAGAGDPSLGGPLERDLLALADRFVTADGTLDLGTPARRGAFDRFTDALRSVVHVLVCALDPEVVVVAWPADPDGRLAEALGPLGPGRDPVRTVPGMLGPDAATRGVAHLALERVADALCHAPGRTGPLADGRSAPVDPRSNARPARERTPHA
ncbi:MAG: ROK family transcriptional regulator [Trueperaceae bacterium]|nr:ROK family transcriptional regulator [Trueperaceae bacterium]